MLRFKDYFLRLKSKFQIEYVLNAILAGIIAFILITATYGLLRPISTIQYRQVVQLSKQQSFPETQEMAKNVLIRHPIRNVDFYRLMHAHHFEISRINLYPAMAIEDE